MKRPGAERTVRIIGGNWRGRKVSFAAREEIRPTPDRVRETLFNWLTPTIAGARCLDLYAGSGILGIEALSRGAHRVDFVDRDRETLAAVRRNLLTLCEDRGRWACHLADAGRWLSMQNDGRFDIAFLDPPFAGNHLTPILGALADGHLADEALVYVESATELGPDMLPPSLTVHRQKRAGQVHYGLLAVTS